MPNAPQAMPARQMPTPQMAPRPMPAPQIMPQIVPHHPQGTPQFQPAQAPVTPQQNAGYMPPRPQGGAPQQHNPMPHQGMPPHAGQPHQHMPPAGMQHMPAMGMPGAIPPHMAVPQDSAPREGGEKALPQISIHSFCDRQETARVINEMSQDWRMKRTNSKIYMGGLSAAIEFYHQENTPSLILVETGMRGDELFSQLESLASVCDEGTKVVIIGAANDIRLYRQLMEKGVSDYIVPPLLALNLIRSLGDLYLDPEAPFIGRVTAFFGAKGGVGSSTLAHNIAWSLSESLGQETSLVDLDSSFGTTGLDFAYDNAHGLEEALSQVDRLDETLLDRIMIRHTQKLSILPAASSLNGKPTMDQEAYESVVNGVRSISPVTILDMPHYWADWTTNILTSVDDVVITATPDLANLRNTKNLVDFLREHRPNDPDPLLILNKTGMSKLAEIPVKEFASAVGLEPSLVISFDPESFFEAANEGKMLDNVKSAEATVNGLAYIATRLKTGRFPQTQDVGKRGLGLGKKSKSKKNDAGQTESKSSLFSFLKKGK
jgi:pilus assembly protein CpaE